MYVRGRAIFIFLVLCLTPALSAATTKAATQDVILAGSRVRVLSIDSGDSNYSERYKYIGRLGTVEKGNLNKLNEKSVYYSGDIELDNGDHLNAWKTSVEILSGPAKTKGTLFTGTKVNIGAWFRIIEISPGDPAYPTRGKLIGQLCFAGSDLYQSYSTTTKGHYYGTVYCADGTTKYFQDFSVELYTGTFKEKPLIMGSVPVYTRVKIASISAKDPSYSKRANLIGKEALVSTALTSTTLTPSGRPYYTGNVTLLTTSYTYLNFTEVELSTFEPDMHGSLTSGPGILPAGTKVEIQSIGRLDKYYNKRSSIEGLFGVVGATDSLYLQKSGSYAGSVMILGVEHQFSDVMVTVIAGGLSSKREETSLEPGQRVLIVDVSKRDPNVSNKAEVVGQVGVIINSSFVPSTAPWYSGSVLCDSGRFLSFTQVAILPLGEGVAPKKETAAKGSTVNASQKVRIIEIGPSDPLANSEKRLTYMTKTGVVTYAMYNSGSSTTTGNAFFSGSITIDGTTTNFYQVALNLLE